MPGDGKDFLLGAAPLGGMAREARLGQAVTTAQKLTNAGGLAGPDEETKRKEAAKQFEALLLQQMMSAMWSTVPKDGVLSGSREEELYRDMLNEAVAKSTAEGQGIGIKEIIARDLGASKAKE